MTPAIDNFIGIYKNALSDEYCDRVVAYFDAMDSAGFCKTRQQFVPGMSKTFKADTSIVVQEPSVLTVQSIEILSEFNAALWGEYYPHYADKFGVLQGSGTHYSSVFKIQKTLVGEGYHVWHYESSDLESCSRLLVWTLYLNSVDEGGETEFLYYSKRVKPEKGTLVIWPCAFTHTHRGNPPISNTKYLATGWIEF